MPFTVLPIAFKSTRSSSAADRLCQVFLLCVGALGIMAFAPKAQAQDASAAPSATKLPIGPAISERVCPQPTPGHAQCTALRLTQRPAEMPLASGAVTETAPSGYGPADLQSAYNLTALSASDGAGVAVAVVAPYDDPDAEADLAVYRSTFGLPACTTANGCFREVNQNGAASPLPPANYVWAQNISIDIDMVSAICPNCKILLVEANSPESNDLDPAENTAFNLGAKAISNGFGGPESSSDPTECSEFYNHPGIAIVAAAGSKSYGIQFPASCKSVTAVGGTSLTRSSNARGWTETVWLTSLGEDSEGTGSGCSVIESKPAWQTDTGCTHRTTNDLSAVADPATGVAVYDTYAGPAGTGAIGWGIFGGTGVSASLIAGVYGLAQPPGASDVPARYAYVTPSAFYDVTAGNNGACSPAYLCTAEVGYDGPTGWGTPNGVAGFEPDDFSIADSPTGLSILKGASGSSHISTTVTQGGAETVALTVTGVPSGATATFTPSSISSGQSATLNINTGSAAPNTYSLTITGTASTGSHSAGLGLTINSPTTTTVTSSVNASTYGQAVHFTATVTGTGTPTGTVQFSVDGVKLGAAVTLASGSTTSPSTSTLTATTSAGHVVTAAYTPSGVFIASSGTLSGGQVVNQAAPTITWPNPAAITYGTPLSATQLDAKSTVAGTFSYSPPAGTVQPAGNRVMFATFTPTDTTDYITVVKSAQIFVNKATPTITWPTPAPITYGTALGATQLDATSSVPGAFAYSPPAGTVLGAGTQTLSVTLTPTDTADYKTAAGSVSLTIVSTTTTTLMSSVNPSVIGQPITFTATVTPTSGTVVPTGTVSFKHQATLLGTAMLINGVASLTTPLQALGTNHITAVYSGSATDVGSTSATLAQVIQKDPTTTVLTSNPNPSASGQLITFTATVTPTYGAVPTGTVTFKHQGTVLGPAVTLDSNGVASLTTSLQALGTNHITAVYSGSTTDVGSTSATLAQVIQKDPTTTVLTSNPNPSASGQLITFTATVTPTYGAAVPTGTVTFKHLGIALGPAATLDSNSVASFTTSTLPAGTAHITAVYAGDAMNTGSTSATLAQIVH